MGKIKTLFRDLSLRKSVVCYVALFAVLAVVLIAATAGYCSDRQNALYAVYTPEGKRYYLTTEEGERLGEGTVIDAGEVYYRASPAVQRLGTFYDLLPTVMMPVYIVCCLFGAAALFYRQKLKRPLEQLNAAAAHIAANDLDFAVSCPSGDEMGRLCASFETMRAALAQNQAQLWRQVEQRRQVNAAFAHDLRTPLTVLKGYSETLQLSGDESTKRTAEIMARQIARLERYVDSMSRLQRLEEESPERRALPAGELTETLRETAEMVCRSAGRRLRFSARTADQTLYVSPEAVAQVFDNLLSNAVRYAERQVSVEVRQARPAGRLVVTVRDDGPGFSPETRRRATEPYYSAGTDRDRHFGLGLYISRVLCENHGGSLEVGGGGPGGCVAASFAAEQPGEAPKKKD